MAIRPLSEALRKKAEEELQETPSRIVEDIKILRDWIQQHELLCSIEAPDQWLVAFLRGCKYNMEKTKGKLEMYYKLKKTLPEFYGNRDPLDPGIQELLKHGVLLPVRKCMRDDSPRIIISRMGQFCSLDRPMTDFIKVGLMTVEILLLEDDNFSIAGQEAFSDSQGISFGFVWQWTPSMARKLFLCMERALSIRIKSIHLINAPLFIGAAVRLFKMFVNAKLRNRIFWHSKDMESVYEHLDKSVLPKDYGGTDGTVDELIEYWKEKVESYRNWFVDENSCPEKFKDLTD